MVKLAILEAVFGLFGFRRSENCLLCVAGVHGTDFLPLGRSYLGFVPCPIVAHTSAHRKVLLVKIDVLPSQTTSLAITKPRVVSYLNGQ